MRHLFRKFIVLTVALVVVACKSQYKTQPIVTLPITNPPATITIPHDGHDSLFSGLYNHDAVILFYEAVNFKPAWFDSLGNSVSADSMITIIRNVRYFGLLPKRYHIAEIDPPGANGLQRIERVDVLLTDAFLKLASELHGGASALPDSSEVDLLVRALGNNELLKSLKSAEPPYSQYRELEDAARRILDTTSLERRDSLLSGQLSIENSSERTLRSIEINLERWRKEGLLKEEGRYVYINVPSFMIRVINNGDVVLESRIIVGAPKTPTPEISSNIECFVIYPYWHVPRKISVEEYLPILQRDTSFIRRNNFDVLDRKGRVLRSDSIDWKRYNKNYFPFSLRQREGEENSLGLIKFVFDNPHAVFVHDTNAKGLFQRKVRTLSHGCIRVERAFDLGHYLLTGEPSKKSQLLSNYLDQKQRRSISLSKPVPIYIRYFTAAVINDKLYLYDDCYEKDAQILNTLGYDSAPVGL